MHMHLSLLRAASCLAMASACAAEYFVSPSGADANPGTLEQPFATLQRLSKRRAWRRGAFPVTITLREGTYYLPETLVFTPEDSGSKAAPVVYQAYQKEQAVVSGGFQAGEPEMGAVSERHHAGQAGGRQHIRSVIVDGNRQPMARYPNFDASVRHFNGYAADAVSPSVRRAGRIPPAVSSTHARFRMGRHALPHHGEGRGHKLTYEGGWQNNRPSGMHSQFRMVENVFEELDAPGECSSTAKTGTLFFYPSAGVNLAAPRSKRSACAISSNSAARSKRPSGSSPLKD